MAKRPRVIPKVAGDPVKALKTLLRQASQPKPVYTEGAERDGLSVSCTVTYDGETLTTTGYGSSPNEAKLQAARYMIGRLSAAQSKPPPAAPGTRHLQAFLEASGVFYRVPPAGEAVAGGLLIWSEEHKLWIRGRLDDAGGDPGSQPVQQAGHWVVLQLDPMQLQLAARDLPQSRTEVRPALLTVLQQQLAAGLQQNPLVGVRDDQR